MTTLRTARLTLFACLSLCLPGPVAAATTLQVAPVNVVATPLEEDQLALLNRLVSSANFTAIEPGLFRVTTARLHAQLSEAGFRNTFNTDMVSYTMSVWYSAALQRSIICVEEWSEAGYQHLAYHVEGRVGQRDPVMY